ncbi:nucleic acid-binding, OB-fold protein [Tanacetum coccineum]
MLIQTDIRARCDLRLDAFISLSLLSHLTSPIQCNGNATTKEPTNFCCILLDKQGNAIQANMDLKDTNYFDQLLQLNNAYRISRFPIPIDSFPEHYFNFIAYNEVEQRADVNGAPLTDYIGCIHRISDPMITGDATRTRKTRRIIDIQNLDGKNLPFIIWNEAAEKFDMTAYSQMAKPIVIAVSSTWATRRYGGLHLTATPATYYYLNPNVPEANYILNVYADFINPVASLEIRRQPYSDDLQEQMSNRYSIKSLLDINPQHYKHIKFTTEARIVEITAPNGWYYRKCGVCNIKVAQEFTDPHCRNHGPQPIPNYGYHFKAIIDDGTDTTSITCFSPNAHTFVPECNTVVNAAEKKDTHEVPATLKGVENKSYIFSNTISAKKQD